jgi:cysteine desulfurase
VRNVYMDHSATTPLDKEVFSAMIPYLTEIFGNPSSVHSPGQKARQALETAREQIAALINASPQEIIFTGSGTEADNQAIISIMQTYAAKGKHLITSAIEHHAVLDTCEYLGKSGYDLTVLPVNNQGFVEPETLEKAIREDTVLVSVMHANNEIGTIQDIEKLGSICRGRGVLFHTDAVQTFGKLSIDVQTMNIDLLSASGHKLYGPKGVGCLYIKKGVRAGKLIYGGAQERNLRAGTENVAGIVGFGKAAELAGRRREEEANRLRILGQRLQEGIISRIPHTILTGPPENRLPGSVSVCFQFVEGESILLMLDNHGIAASSGSACTSGALDPSHVLLAIGLPHEIAHGSLRLTMGHENTEADVDYILEVLPGVIETLRSISPLYVQKGVC